ncbi:hypothetical protein NKT77_09985 [Moraxella sp. FZLJ2107]|uniref:hypothetical protein n=1 Tax=Moraxella sp. FZLJ2107 TaxID=2961618 RepID=UPI0020C901CC|nr:hypothetical protein [Moraxella sp. FZLJ2107]UTO04805.1 hypothetical protein NKT77_09925 [Moraxella sp. FZLJ2107]UTO04817.1 hypothetical protein NKT77_09985 [Moraxella sp. FZLJ2107]
MPTPPIIGAMAPHGVGNTLAMASAQAVIMPTAQQSPNGSSDANAWRGCNEQIKGNTANHGKHRPMAQQLPIMPTPPTAWRGCNGSRYSMGTMVWHGAINKSRAILPTA